MATLWLGVKHKEILPFGKHKNITVGQEILQLGKKYYRWVSVSGSDPVGGW